MSPYLHKMELLFKKYFDITFDIVCISILPYIYSKPGPFYNLMIALSNRTGFPATFGDKQDMNGSLL